MEKTVVGMIVVAFRMLLRIWAKDSNLSDVFTSNLIDITQFAEKYGWSYFDISDFNLAIERFVNKIAKDFIGAFGAQIEDEERKEAIIYQIQQDIQKINLDESKFISLSSNPSTLQMLIMEQSEAERMSWSENEIGLYTNCVQYISKMGMDFVSELPTFSVAALKTVCKRQEEYSDKLDEILQEVHSMEELLKQSDVKYRKYENIYRQKIIEKYGKIELIGSKIQDRKIKRYDITSAYVELNCISDKSMEEIKLSKVFKAHNVIWIKGEAGAGKTTFLQWVAVCSAKGERIAIENIENTIPIVVGLRNIEWPLDLHNVVNKITSSEGIQCPDGWVYELLQKQEVVLLFDGLDEISVARRNEIYDYIEDTSNKYPQVRMLLTARNSVKDSINCAKSCYEIIPMKMDRIIAFIEYWHESVLRRDAVLEDNEIEHLKDKLKQRIFESQSLKELACNPLLCAMLCALNYVNNEQLPENKMQLFDQCCEMLMDARDSQRNIDVNIYDNVPKFDYLMKRRILEEIAFRMINNGVSSENKQTIVCFLREHLQVTKVISDVKGDSVENILNFFIERSGIIREPEEGVIDFIHKTFMEFLAVRTICRNCYWDLLIKEACNVNWRETIVMCFSEMGNANIEYVLEKLVAKGKAECDDRYFLMASLCVSNAKFFYSPIKDEIDEKIRGMIPPSEEKIDEMAELGSYLLSFLKNSEAYSAEDKYNCLQLLATIKMKEAIPVILTYIKYYSDPFFIPIYQFAVDLLWQYPANELEEYNVREYSLKNMLDYVNGDKLIICETMLYILNNYQLSDKYEKKLKGIKNLIILGQNSKNQKVGKISFGKHFEKCENVRVIGGAKNLSFLSPFMNIRRLEIESNVHLVTLTYELKVLGNLKSVITLHIQTNQPEIRYINRMAENMKNIECIEIVLDNKDLSLEADTFDCFPRLKEVKFAVDEILAREIENRRDQIKGKKEDLIITLV